MLDFIVLGIVPGTHFVITLWWSLVFSLVFLVLVLVYVEKTKSVKPTRRSYPVVDLEAIHTPRLIDLVAPGRSIWVKHLDD